VVVWCKHSGVCVGLRALTARSARALRSLSDKSAATPTFSRSSTRTYALEHSRSGAQPAKSSADFRPARHAAHAAHTPQPIHPEAHPINHPIHFTTPTAPNILAQRARRKNVSPAHVAHGRSALQKPTTPRLNPSTLASAPRRPPHSTESQIFTLPHNTRAQRVSPYRIYALHGSAMTAEVRDDGETVREHARSAKYHPIPHLRLARQHGDRGGAG
jgi:hypothetical protein